MPGFIGALEESITETDALLEKQKISNISVDDFIQQVQELGGMGKAILNLDDNYLQFYSDNQRTLDRLLKKHNLMESYSQPGDNNYDGWSKTSELKFKTIKYKGYLITLEWDPDLGTWQPTIRMRSVTNALRYAKEMVDLAKERS